MEFDIHTSIGILWNKDRATDIYYRCLWIVRGNRQSARSLTNGVWVRDGDMEWYDSATSGNQNQAGAYQDCGTGQRARFGMSFPSRLIEARDTISHVVHGRPGQGGTRAMPVLKGTGTALIIYFH